MLWFSSLASSVSIHEAKTHFSKLVRRAEEGEEIVVRRGSEPVAQIGPLKEKPRRVRGFGSMKGEIWIAPDFDEPLEEFAEYEK
jgi:prevent-host-death family protein